MRFYHLSNILFMTAIKSDINLINLKSNKAKIRNRTKESIVLHSTLTRLLPNSTGTSTQSKKSLSLLEVLVLSLFLIKVLHHDQLLKSMFFHK